MILFMIFVGYKLKNGSQGNKSKFINIYIKNIIYIIIFI